MHSGNRYFDRCAEVSILVMGLAALPIQTLSADPAPTRAVPPELRLAINRTIGRDQDAYRFRESGAGCFEARCTALGADALVGLKGLTVRTGVGAWTLGASANLASGAEPAPGLPRQTAANRVEVDRGWAIEWVVNGPSGLEQGWAIPKRPSWATEKDPLLIPLEQGDNLRAVATEADGRALCVRDAQGRDILRYAGLHVTDATGRELPACFETRPGDGALWIKVMDTGAAYPITVDPWVENAKLFASDRQLNDNLGYSVALSSNGMICAAGTILSSSGGTNAGAVYIFTNAGGSWAGVSNQAAKLFATDRQPGDWLGQSVALSADGGICAVGAVYSDPGGANNAGAVYVFTNAGGSWAGVSNQAAKLFASDRQEDDNLGCSVALSADGGICAAAAGFSSPGGTNCAGAVYIFTNAAGRWSGVSNETAKLFASDRQPNDFLGSSVALSADGGICAAGASSSSPGGTNNAGAVYIFTNAAGSWAGVSNENAKLAASDRSPSDFLGWSVALSADGRVCAAGAYGSSPGGTNAAGAVYIFTNAAGNWAGVSNQNAKLIASDRQEADHLGCSVALSANGGICAAGAFYSSPGGTTNAGAVYIFTNVAGSWAGVSNQNAKLVASDGQADDNLGSSVALSADGGICAAGTPGSDPGGTNNAGAAYVFYNSVSMPNCSVLGTNGAAIANGAAASAEKGTDFGSLSWGSALTNRLSITNAGGVSLSISGVTTSGSGAVHFRIAGMPSAVAGGAKSNFSIMYVPGAVGTHTAAVSIVNNSAISPYIVYLSGTCGKAAQTITFPAISNQVVSGAVGLRATASSGLAVSFAVVSGPAAISGNTNLSFTGAGQVSVRASQTGNATYAAAPNVTNTFTVSKATQTITFAAIPAQHVTNRLTLSATAGSGLAVSFAVGSGPAAISGNVATFSATGLVSIIASQTGNASWAAAPNVTNTFTVSKATQTITFAAIPAQHVTNRLTLSATAGSGLAVSFAVGSGPAAINGNVATFSATGLVSIIASQTGNASWAAAPDVTNTFTVSKATQTITFAAIPAQYVTNRLTLSAAAGSGLAVSFAVGSGPAAISGNAATFSATGRVSIIASQTGNASWAAAPNVTNTFNVLPLGSGWLGVLILPAGAVAAGAQWRMDGGAWRNSATLVTGVTAGAHTVNFSAVHGYSPPADQEAAVVANQLALVQGTYVKGVVYPDLVPFSADFDGDHKADPSIYWNRFQGYSISIAMPYLSTRNFAYSGPYVFNYSIDSHMPMGADFDGDGFADLGFYCANNGTWSAYLSKDKYQKESVLQIMVGNEFCLGLAADFDGDGKADPTVYNPAAGDWTFAFSSRNYAAVTFANVLGGTGFAAAAGDGDGDKLADPYVCNLTTGQWKMKSSKWGYYEMTTPEGWLGEPGDQLALADYDGDGLADPAVYKVNLGSTQGNFVLCIRLSSCFYQMWGFNFVTGQYFGPVAAMADQPSGE